MMSDYTVSRISSTDKRAVRQMDALLEKEGIERDKNLDYSIGLFDDNYDLVATGSCFANTLRCMAVSSEHQGEGLMNQIISNFQADGTDLLVGVATPVAMAMQAATEGTQTPVVFAAVSDPMSVDLVDSLDAPGSNITDRKSVV